MSDHRNEIRLREADGPGEPRPDILEQLVSELVDVLAGSGESGKRYFRGKGNQELAKATRIQAEAIEKIAAVQNEREEMIRKRDEAEQRVSLENKTSDNAHEQRMYELRTERIRVQSEALAAVAVLIREASEKGVEIDIRLVHAVVRGEVELD